MVTVLLTGGGAAPLPKLIEHLKATGLRVYVADMDPQAAGLYLADRGFVVPPAADDSFLPALRHVCHMHKVNVLIPFVDEELLKALELEKEGIPVLLPRADFVRTCLDKYALMQALAKHGIGAPATRLADHGVGDLTGPFILKPRAGRGSRGLHFAQNADEVRTLLASGNVVPGQTLLQECVEGPEYTVSVVVWRDGNVQAIVPKRILVKRGTTRMAVTEQQAAVEQTCLEVQQRLRADGPFNVQLRVDQRTGEPRIFEINPRFSGTSTLTVAAGVDEVGGLIAKSLGQATTPIPSTFREGLVLLRRVEDEFWPADRFEQARARIQRASDC